MTANFNNYKTLNWLYITNYRIEIFCSAIEIQCKTCHVIECSLCLHALFSQTRPHKKQVLLGYGTRQTMA